MAAFELIILGVMIVAGIVGLAMARERASLRSRRKFSGQERTTNAS